MMLIIKLASKYSQYWNERIRRLHSDTLSVELLGKILLPPPLSHHHLAFTQKKVFVREFCNFVKEYEPGFVSLHNFALFLRFKVFKLEKPTFLEKVVSNSPSRTSHSPPPLPLFPAFPLQREEELVNCSADKKEQMRICLSNKYF